jgi:hypothetical protein
VDEVASAVHQIEGGRRHRGRPLPTLTTLPSPESDQAQDITKDPYSFDFSRSAMMLASVIWSTGAQSLRQFSLELCVGFAFVGNVTNGSDVLGGLIEGTGNVLLNRRPAAGPVIRPRDPRASGRR